MAENAQAVKETIHDVEKPAGEQLQLLCGLCARSRVSGSRFTRSSRGSMASGVTISEHTHTRSHISLSHARI